MQQYPSTKSPYISILGTSLLETAIILPLILTLMLAAFDLSNALSSYGALKVAVEQAVTEAITIKTDPKSLVDDNRNRYYNWIRYSTSSNPGEYPITTSAVIAKNMVEGVTPAQCLNPPSNVKCVAEFSRFSSSDDKPSYEIDLTRARDTGLAELRVALPRYRLDCDGKQCLKLDLNLESDIDGNPQRVQALAQYELPLLVLGKTPIKLSALADGVVEEALIRHQAFGFNPEPTP